MCTCMYGWLYACVYDYVLVDVRRKNGCMCVDGRVSACHASSCLSGASGLCF
eukprot:m.127912 g.127912  ORF g.127912 m.127912 type:complete len:52 (-) comp15667_c1_seq1:12-167(-)